MKAIFVHFYDLAPHSGISKKIIYQIDALKWCGMDTELCYMDIDEQGFQKRVCGNRIIENYGKGLCAKFLKWVKFKSLTDYILSSGIQFVYIRSFYNTNPSLLKMLKRLKAAGVKIVMEIPTYPYDNELDGAGIIYKPLFFIHKLLRNRLKHYLTRIVTFSDFKEIHGVKTINISNGVDFESIKVKSGPNDVTHKFNLIGVADIHYWHGFDRVIKGLGEYYKINRKVEVIFDIVGDGVSAEVHKLAELTQSLKLGIYVNFHGNCFGDKLDRLFEQADFGIASLARHRSQITKIKTLKNREYAARGIPFIYSEIDDDFENMPYIMKAPADESPIDIQAILDFYNSLKLTPGEIRESIVDTLSWKVQMQKVIDETFNDQ